MGAFLAALGGAGNAASKYGEQVRNLLESRRHDFVSVLTQAIADERDPQSRAIFLKTATGLADNKSMHDLLPPLVEHLQKRFEGNKAISDALGGPPTPPKPSGIPPPFTALSPIKPVEGGGGGGPASSASAAPSMGMAPGSAAMPSTSPIAPAQGGEGLSAPPAPQAQAAPTIPPIQSNEPPSLPTAEQIYQKYNAMPEAMTPAGWKGLQAVMTPEIQQNEELRREQATRRMDLDERQKALANIKRLYPGLPPQQMAQFELWASSRSAPVPAMTGAMMTPTVSRVQAESMSADQRALHGIPPDANGPYWIYVNKLTGEPSRQAQPAATTSAMVAGENGLEFVPRIPGKIAPAGGGAALPPSALTPRNTGVNSTGQNVYNDVFGIRSGSPLGQSPGLLPQISSSTISSPGSAPVTTQTERRRGGISGPTPPAAGAPKSTSSAAPAITPISGSTGNAIAERAKKVASGDLPLPAGRDGAAVQQYMAEHAMELPTPMSPKGQENIARVDSVLMEIQDLNSALAAIKGNPSLAVDYARYKYLGQSTPYDALFTKISFEGLRSAAAALQGNGSRAYPVIKRAFEHIPNLDRLGGLNPDSVSLMKDKLKAMQKVLEDTRKTVMSDEKKSGVIGGLEPAVGTVEDGYRYKGGGASTPSNWEPVGAGR